MDYKVVFKDTFVEDLERVIMVIATHNPDAAFNLGEHILAHAESLSFFPERHPPVRQRTGIRRFVARRRYKVFYRVLDESRTVEILR